jgi:DNA ligase-1
VTRLADVAAASGRVAGTASRSAKTDELARLLRQLRPEEIEIAVPYLSGETRQGKLSLGHAALRSAKGPAAAMPSLELAEVDETFARLKTLKGKGVGARRTELLQALLSRATAGEQDFLLRLIIGELRQGALEGVLQDAVAAAAGLPPAEIRRAATFGGLAPVARAALAGEGLSRFTIQALQPVQPMLAQPAEDVAAALAVHPRALFEWKLDGARVQVHKAGGEVRVFTRNLNDVTARVPEIAAVLEGKGEEGMILDGEVIALRPDGRPHPFQVTMRRFGRKLDVDAQRRELPLAVFFFDCLMKNGEPLVDRGTLDRRKALGEIFSHQFITPHLLADEPEAAEAFYRAALAAGHEGVMAKAPDAPYEAGRRGAAWLKIKTAKTLDLVVLAVEWGSGRRKGWLSNLHLGARDPQTGGFVMLGKTFKGLTDEILEWQTKELLARETRRDAYTVYVRPELVVEIAFNDLQESSHYPGGVALRFARVKGYRPDKRAEEADTIDTVRKLHTP